MRNAECGVRSAECLIMNCALTFPFSFPLALLDNCFLLTLWHILKIVYVI